MGKFINPFTDFGFKHIFGREMDKDILVIIYQFTPPYKKIDKSHFY